MKYLIYIAMIFCIPHNISPVAKAEVNKQKKELAIHILTNFLLNKTIVKKQKRLKKLEEFIKKEQALKEQTTESFFTIVNAITIS